MDEKENERAAFEVGQLAWVIAPYEVASVPVLVTIVERYKGATEPTCTVEFEGQKYTVLESQLFDIKPRKVIVEDDMGRFTKWE